MFENYLKTTWRHLLKSKLNFIFKLGGLTLALLSFAVIAIYVSFQLSFDRFHEGYKNIYRVNSNRDEGGVLEKYAMVPPGLGQALQAEFPEVRSSARITEPGWEIIRVQDKLLRLPGFTGADSSIFDVLSFTFLKGNKNALNRPGTIVLTQSLAQQIFGDADPINKLLTFPDRENQIMEVTAIVEDLPSNSHLDIKAIMQLEVGADPWQISWDGSVYLFILLDGQADSKTFADKVKPLLLKNLVKKEDGSENNFSIFLQRIEDIYLGPRMSMEFHKKGNANYVYIFSLLGVFLLIIAGINYIHLSIADFHRRQKELGVRKVLGARKIQVAFQVVTESVFFCAVSLTLALATLYILFPHISPVLEPSIHFEMLLSVPVLSAIAVSLLFMIILSTAYPAFLLALNRPVNDLKGESGLGRNSSVSNMLLTTQFIISILSISATLVISDQINYIKTRDIGFDRNNLLTLMTEDPFPMEKMPVLKNEIARVAGVEAVSYAYYHITGVPYFQDLYHVEINGEMKLMPVNEMFIDYDFFQAMQINILQGRGFDMKNPADARSAYIVNETAVKEFGWKDPLGKRIRYHGNPQNWEGSVVGVVQDFNTRSLHEKIEAVVIRLPFDEYPGMCLNVRTSVPAENVMESIKAAFEKYAGFPADIRIVEDMYDRQYIAENNAYNALQAGTWVILLISSLGVFSLSVYLSLRRMKEFGIRKVLGASGGQIMLMHIGHFLRLALIGNIIALPVSYLVMKEWLDGFAYKADLSAFVFLSVLFISFLLVFFSAGYASLKAGRMNPLDVIKME